MQSTCDPLQFPVFEES